MIKYIKQNIINALYFMLEIFKHKFSICEHEWMQHGWSYIKCKKCGSKREDPEKNRELYIEMIVKRCNHPVMSKLESGTHKMFDRI